LSALADDEAQLEMYAAAQRHLAAAGFEHYEISNFARRGHHSRHNVNYWLNGSYLGVGASATAYIGGERKTNIADIRDYIRCIRERGGAAETRERLDAEVAARETAAFSIRCLSGIDRNSFRERTGFGLDDLLGSAIRENVDLCLLEDNGRTVRLTERGLAVADSVSASFL
jgi:oxygen-independent coproporphyrinogen-3 oxidase